MPRITIKLKCCLCSKTISKSITVAGDWKIAYENVVEEELAFCPDHAPVEDWRKANCTDCKESFGNCNLFKSFIYKNKTLNITDYVLLEDGFCPKKNGSDHYLVKTSAVRKGGWVLSEAIKRYGRNDNGKNN